MIDEKYPDLKESYDKLNMDSSGQIILNLTISLCLFEKKFRENGIDEKMIEGYNEILKAYKNLISLNEMSYKEHYDFNKSR